MNRIGIGLATLAVVGLGLWAWSTGRIGLAGAALRVGVVLSAVFVAWPAVTDVRSRNWWWLATAIALVAWRPKAAWLVIPVLIFVTTRRRPER